MEVLTLTKANESPLLFLLLFPFFSLPYYSTHKLVVPPKNVVLWCIGLMSLLNTFCPSVFTYICSPTTLQNWVINWMLCGKVCLLRLSVAWMFLSAASQSSKIEGPKIIVYIKKTLFPFVVYSFQISYIFAL